MTPLRISPIHDQLQLLNGAWREINSMPTLATLADEVNTVHLGIADLSFLTRFGVKGAGAAPWLASQEISVPDRLNTWCLLPAGGIVARLGRNEFLIEDSLHTNVAFRLETACQQPSAQVYPVLRQDAAIALCGKATNELLLQVCSVNFQALSLVENPVVLTSMAGVAVTVIPGDRNGQPFYRIWCDGTFGADLWQTLLAIAQELGGGVVGAEQLI